MDLVLDTDNQRFKTKSAEYPPYDMEKCNSNKPVGQGTLIAINVRNISYGEVRYPYMRLTLSDPMNDPCRPTLRFTAQIIVINTNNSTKGIRNGFLPLVYCSMHGAPCRLQKIIATVDKKTGELVESEPESLKNGDSALVEFVPESSRLIIETFAEFPPFGRILIQNSNLTVAVGVVKEVVKASAIV